MIDLAEKEVLVVGLGMSGAAAARTAIGLGARVEVIDRSETPLRVTMVKELRDAGVRVSLGMEVPADLTGYDLLVVSPGVPDRAPVLSEARRCGLKIVSELELGYRLLDGIEMVAVTGTNGKTTTTKLIGEILSEGRGSGRAVTCGNIGNPVVGLYGEVGPEDVLVIEVSSFQLQNIEKFRARVAVALNVAPDHYDWHRDFEEYRLAKMRLVENMLSHDFLVYNLEDESCRMMAKMAVGIRAGFSGKRRQESAVWIEDGWVTAGPPFDAGKVLSVLELKLAGAHNLENVMAATGAALAMGHAHDAIREAAGKFEGLEHRVEYVTDIDGVSFYNDSKATNPHAALHALRSFESPTVAIMGGRNKGLDFAEVASEVCARLKDGRMRGLVLVGESAPEILEAVESVCRGEADGHLAIAKDLADSVEKAYRLSGGCGVVIFTPACASFDMFKDYEDRGRVFKEAVGNYKRGSTGDGSK
jgi:UDP-N-acetylmuramoylalanine--D-glutamate ligase